jgi:hypothetical protein
MQTRISQPKPTGSSILAELRDSRTAMDFCGRQDSDWQNLQGSHVSASLYFPEVKT